MRYLIPITIVAGLGTSIALAEIPTRLFSSVPKLPPRSSASERPENSLMPPKPTLYGRELSSDEFERIRTALESLDWIPSSMSSDMRALIATQWPHLLPKVRPAKPS